MLAFRSFARRLLVQALVSSTVMAGLQGVMHLAPALLPFGNAPSETSRPATTAPDQPVPGRPQTASAGRPLFAEDRTHADVKAGRFSAWREREPPPAETPHARIASRSAIPDLGDVVLFDRCRPNCESRDPLLALNQQPSATTPPLRRTEVPESGPVEDSPPFPTEADNPPEPPEDRNMVAAAARGSVSWARRMAESAGSALSW